MKFNPINASVQYQCIQTKTISFHLSDRKQYLCRIFDPEKLKLLTRLRLALSHLNEHRFLTLDVSSPETENRCCYLMYYHNYTNFFIHLIKNLNTFAANFESLPDSEKVEIILYGDSLCDENKNSSILISISSILFSIIFYYFPFSILSIVLYYFLLRQLNILIVLFLIKTTYVCSFLPLRYRISVPNNTKIL